MDTHSLESLEKLASNDEPNPPPESTAAVRWFSNHADFLTETRFELIPQRPAGFIEHQVIVRRLHMDGASPAYFELDEATPVINNPDYFGIHELAAKVAAGTYTKNRDDQEETKRRDIRVSRPSFIILRLQDSLQWDFSPTVPAIAMPQVPNPADPPKHYGALRYVRSDGMIFKDPFVGCKTVYFAAMPVLGTDNQPYTQKFNYYVHDLVGMDGIVIDPDIRYPGNGES